MSQAGHEFGFGFGLMPACKRSASIRFMTTNHTMTPLLGRKRSVFEATISSVKTV